MGDIPSPRTNNRVVLPSLVEGTISLICSERNVDPPNHLVRQLLAGLGEQDAFQTVEKIRNSPGKVRNLNTLIRHRIEQLSGGGGSGGSASPQLYFSGSGGGGGCTVSYGACFSPSYATTSPPPPPTTISSSTAGGFSAAGNTSAPAATSNASYPSPPATVFSGGVNPNSPPSAPPSAAYSSPSFRAWPSSSYSPPPPPPHQFGVSAASPTDSSTFSDVTAAPLPAHSPSFPNVSAGVPSFSLDFEGSSSKTGNSGTFLCSTSGGDVDFSRVNRRLDFHDVEGFWGTKNSGRTNDLLMILDQLEFRRLFLLLSYLGRHNLEEVLTLSDARSIARMKDSPMFEFESGIWREYGSRYVRADDRLQTAQWDSGKTHIYNCDVFQDGSFTLMGPCLATTRTHLQRSIGDDNVLVVKFFGDDIENANIVLTEGILVGLKRYHFFVFKDECKATKKKDKNENGSRLGSNNVKCYFVNLDSIGVSGTNGVRPFPPFRNIGQARCVFMHIHMVSSMAKYMARFSLILSKTIKFPVDLSSVNIQIIEDIPCKDENGCIVYGEDHKPLIHTDGTGFISEDLAQLCPQEFGIAKFIKTDLQFQKFRDVIGLTGVGSGFEALNCEPPLLMQCRIFSKGLAVKGTLLLNKKLKRTIQVRPSMVKVERDERLPVQTFDSLEINAASHKPRKANLSRTLIALLSYGGVPRNFFLNLLTCALNDTNLVFSDMYTAMKISVRHGEMDDDYTAFKMISAGVPLNEPHLQDRLCKLAIQERNQLKSWKLPISESFYLMGTTDPTGVLKNNEVCVVLENGQISGKVLVYRNPGLHFGDIHVMEAVYNKDLESFIGNSKYAIFFSVQGRRSAAAEMGNGDFDGDTYWVSRNQQLLGDFRASEPWSRISDSHTPSGIMKPIDYPSEETLEAELFRLFKNARFPSLSMSTASENWTSFMDRLLMEKDDQKRGNLKQILHRLIDIYYDALDAPKSGKKIDVPPHLMAKDFPHYMENKRSTYKSTSILGEMYNMIQQFEPKGSEEGIWKIPFFEQCPQTQTMKPALELWSKLYNDYRKEMAVALKQTDKDLKNSNAEEVYRKYKKLLYDGVEDFSESRKDSMQIYNEALAIYHVSYNYAINWDDRLKCGFPWRVAGPVLCKLLAFNQKETPILILPSVLKALL